MVRRLKSWPIQRLPAVIELSDDRASVLLEIQSRDGLIHAPGIAEPMLDIAEAVETATVRT